MVAVLVTGAVVGTLVAEELAADVGEETAVVDAVATDVGEETAEDEATEVALAEV